MLFEKKSQRGLADTQVPSLKPYIKPTRNKDPRMPTTIPTMAPGDIWRAELLLSAPLTALPASVTAEEVLDMIAAC